jgi:nitrite reductase/ring-hydroxylating ferredoxin subunit
MSENDPSTTESADGRYHPVAAVEELKESGTKVVDTNPEIVVFHVEGEFYAFSNRCVHQGAPLCDGEIRGTLLEHVDDGLEYSAGERILICPWHGWEFDIDTGEHLARPDQYKVPTFKTIVEDDYVYVKL